MTSFALAAVLQAAVVSASGASYASAYQESQESGRPLVVLVGADWCPACVQMKRDVLPQLSKNEAFGQVAFAIVDLDRQPSLCRQMTGGGAIPQLIMYRRTKEGWRRARLVGAQSASEVVRFLERGVEAPPMTLARDGDMLEQTQ